MDENNSFLTTSIRVKKLLEIDNIRYSINPTETQFEKTADITNLSETKEAIIHKSTELPIIRDILLIIFSLITITIVIIFTFTNYYSYWIKEDWVNLLLSLLIIINIASILANVLKE